MSESQNREREYWDLKRAVDKLTERLGCHDVGEISGHLVEVFERLDRIEDRLGLDHEVNVWDDFEQEEDGFEQEEQETGQRSQLTTPYV